MPTVKLSDVNICFEEHGSGPPLLFIHGFPLHRQLWEGQWNALADAAQVIAPDLRGHGESESGVVPHTMQNLAQDCFDLLGELGISAPLYVCGLSMGGYIAMAMLRLHPERIAGLILTATRSAADTPEARTNRDKSILLAQTQGPRPIIDSMLPRLLSPKSLAGRPEIVQTAHEIMSSISVNTIIKDLLGLKERPDLPPSWLLLPNPRSLFMVQMTRLFLWLKLKPFNRPSQMLSSQYFLMQGIFSI